MATIKERICFVCRQKKPATELIRIARIDSSDDNSKGISNVTRKYLIDEVGNQNGRGCHICSSCVEKAIKTRALNKSFKANVGNEIYESLANRAEKIYTKK